MANAEATALETEKVAKTTITNDYLPRPRQTIFIDKLNEPHESTTLPFAYKGVDESKSRHEQILEEGLKWLRDQPRKEKSTIISCEWVGEFLIKMYNTSRKIHNN